MRRTSLYVTIPLILVVTLLAAPGLLSPHQLAHADVGELPEPGGLITPGDKTDQIRMKSEKVVFSVRPNDGTFTQPEAQYYAHVTADFVMQNLSSKAASMDLFFPLHLSYLPAYQNPAYAVMKQAENVKVVVDGREVQVSYTELALSPPQNVVAAVFPVDFPVGSETAIEVEYDVRAVNEGKSSSLSFKYMMQTGSHWAGTIGSGKVIFQFWQPVDSKSAFIYVNDFFQTKDGRLEWSFADLEPTPDHDITITFEPNALETWAERPSYVKDIQAGTPAARAIPDSCLACLLDTTRAGWGWIVEQGQYPGGEWIELVLDRPHPVMGLRIRTGIPVEVEDYETGSSRVVWDAYRRPRTVAISLSGALTQTVTLADTPAEWQIVSLPGSQADRIRLTFLDSYPGSGEHKDLLGLGHIELLGVDAGGPEAGECSGPNLLRNGDFEQGFDGHGVGLGWNGFSSGEGAAYHFYGDAWPRAVYKGAQSQLVAISSYGPAPTADRYAGIYQAVTGLEPGAEYELSLAGLLREEGPHPDEDPYRYRVQWAFVQGDADWTQVAAWQDLPWDTLYLRTEPGPFSIHTARLLAPSDSATLFIRAWKKWATSGRELDVNLDAITLRKCEP